MHMVSIIIPYIHEVDYLAEAITSARAQLDVDIEIIAVCNAPEWIRPDDEPDDVTTPVRWVHEPQKGSAFARNAGLQLAMGEWIQFLDVDDLLYPEKIHHQIGNADAEVIVSPHLFLFLNGQTVNAKWLPDDVWIGLLNSGLGSTSSMLWRRTALLDVGGWSTDWHSHQEYELLMRLMAAGKKVQPNDHCETMVRQRASGSITLTSGAIRIQEGLRLREAMWHYIKTQGLDTPERYDAFRQYVFRQMRGLFRQDPDAALRLHQNYFGNGSFIPQDIHVPGYALLYKILGFRLTERLILRWLRLGKGTPNPQNDPQGAG